MKLLCAVAIALLSAGGPAYAARVLYAFTGNEGYAAFVVNDGYLSIGPDPASAYESGLGCLGGSACGFQLDMQAFRTVFLTGGGPRGFRFPTAAASTSGSYSLALTDPQSGGERQIGQLTVRALALTDVVYAFLGNDGYAAYAVNAGYLSSTTDSSIDYQDAFGCLGGVACGFQLNRQALSAVFLTGGGVRSFRFPTTAAGASGTYSLSVIDPLFGGARQLGRLFVIGPEAVATPEPATWTMMIAGFGLIGGALRRRLGQVAKGVRPARS